MDTLTPTPDEFRNLYEAALAFKELAPWEWMLEDEIFGIRNPQTGQIGYASVMGNLGEHLALGVPLGRIGADLLQPGLINGGLPHTAEQLTVQSLSEEAAAVEMTDR